MTPPYKCRNVIPKLLKQQRPIEIKSLVQEKINIVSWSGLTPKRRMLPISSSYAELALYSSSDKGSISIIE